MRKLKLSLVGILALGAFSNASAGLLEDAIKRVDFDGELRYRYDTGRWDASKHGGLSGITQGGAVEGSQVHRFRTRLGVNADIFDGFRVYGQVQYGEDENGGYGIPATADTPFHLRQAYLEYANPLLSSSIKLGRQELGTIWTDDMVGMAAKVENSGIEGLNISVFAVDSFEEDSDRIGGDSVGSDFIFSRNLYGMSAKADYALGTSSSLKAELALAYLDKRATFYALDLGYGLKITPDLQWDLRVTYLGNSLDNQLKEYLGGDEFVANGNLVNLVGSIEGYGFDGYLGGLYYGSKNKGSINTIEDLGAFGLDMVGREILYTQGSLPTEAFGQNTIAYLGAGYTLPADVRVGVRVAYGATQTGRKDIGYASGGGTKTELAAEISYPYSNKLEFSAWYSNLNWKGKTDSVGVDPQNSKNTVQLEAIYKF